MKIKLNTQKIKNLDKFIKNKKVLQCIQVAHDNLHNPQTTYTGWARPDEVCEKEDYKRIKNISKQVQANSDVLLVIGIGGSYLGACSAIKLLNPNPKVEVKFIGSNLNASEIVTTFSACKNKRVSVVVVSKSGNSTETAVTFYLVEQFMKLKYCKKDEYKQRIFIITDKTKGELRKIAEMEGYESFVIPQNVGGRFSVLSPVGLFPMAVSGINIDKVVKGLNEAYDDLNNASIQENPAYMYAAARCLMLKKGFKIEALCYFDGLLITFAEWYKQLFAETEGKNKKGLFVTSFFYTRDLHSFGQYVEDGSPILFETFLKIKKLGQDVVINNVPEDRSVAYLNGKSVNELNDIASTATMYSHNKAGVPVLEIEVDSIDETTYGYLVYFFEKACAVSAYLIGINPFNQPGVEGYKNKMREILDNKN